jgi:hypothetical protein
MKTLYLPILSLSIFAVAGKAIPAIATPQSSVVTKSQPTAHANSMQKSSSYCTANDQQIVGHLGHPLGKIVTISGKVRQAGVGSKSLQDVLFVEVVNGIRLAQPVEIEFDLFVTAQVPKPLLGRSFSYVGYETGGFTGIPSAAFKYVPAVATTDYRFTTSFQILREELDVVKTKADLIRFKDRRVVAIGRYQSHTRQAPDRAGIIGFKGNYITANIVLEDDTEIPIYPTYLKQSLRSPDEVKAFEGKIVKAIGLIQTETAPSSESRIAFIGLDGIWHYQANF